MVASVSDEGFRNEIREQQVPSGNDRKTARAKAKADPSIFSG
jgi:hypothetical protein